MKTLATTLILAAGLAVSLCVSAQADVIISLEPAPGTDLSHVFVGETVVLDTIASSTDAGEHFISCCDVHLLGVSPFTAPLTNADIAGVLAPTAFNDLTTDPVIATWTIFAAAPGIVTFINGWPDCTGLPSVTTGCAITNLGATRPADSNRLQFDILVPEPPSAALLGAALGVLGLAMFWRRKSRSFATAEE